MSHLNYLEKLLDGVEVEWLSLGDISEKISSGGTPKTGVPEYYNGDIPWLRTQEVDFGDIWDTGVKITEAGVKDSSAKWIPANCVIIAMYGATVGKIGINKIPMTTNQACANIALNSKVADYKYVFHFLSSQYEYIKSLGSGSQTNINAGIVKKLLIPIPCPDNPEKSLAIQSEIVRILDKFTALTAELTAELNMRKKQYSHYQFELLKFTETTQQLSIGECCDINKGATPIKKATPGKYPLVATTEERQSSSEYQFDCPAVCVPLISSRGHGVASIDRIYYQDGKFALGNILCAITPKDSEVLSAKFLRYYLFDKKDVLLVPLMRGGANVSLTMDSLKKVKIPIPPIADQQRIVRALDKFDEFVKALPREIELRQKQYEYYRDLLLNFPKSHSNEVA